MTRMIVKCAACNQNIKIHTNKGAKFFNHCKVRQNIDRGKVYQVEEEKKVEIKEPEKTATEEIKKQEIKTEVKSEIKSKNNDKQRREKPKRKGKPSEEEQQDSDRRSREYYGF